MIEEGKCVQISAMLTTYFLMLPLLLLAPQFIILLHLLYLFGSSRCRSIYVSLFLLLNETDPSLLCCVFYFDIEFFLRFFFLFMLTHYSFYFFYFMSIWMMYVKKIIQPLFKKKIKIIIQLSSTKRQAYLKKKKN